MSLHQFEPPQKMWAPELERSANESGKCNAHLAGSEINNLKEKSGSKSLFVDNGANANFQAIAFLQPCANKRDYASGATDNANDSSDCV